MKAVAIRAGAAAVCVAAAVILVLLAIDARAWSSRFPADDLRYRRDASAPKLWSIGELSPFGLDRKVLGIKDDLAYRRALREFRLGRPLEPVFTTAATTHRVQAQIALTDVVATPGHAKRASQAANLLGVLGFAMATQDVGQRVTFLNNAITAFRQAIALDPTNDDALFNLEYALDQLKGSGEQQAGGSERLGQRGRAGLKPTGHGY
jgi:tetratricopeptide (TPR) repeat protein